MPRATTIVMVSLLALVLSVPGTVGTPAAASLVTGRGTASTFYIESDGPGGSLGGGGYDRTLVCGDCFVRVTVTGGGYLEVPGRGALDPGTYEMREFRGLIAFVQNAPGDFSFDVHGYTHVHRVD